jgi:pyridoxal phosphate enzyme (YggS family)
MTDVASATLRDRAEAVRNAIRTAAEASGRRADEVTVVAVSKTVERRVMQDAYALGFRHFGENRVSEARAKLSEAMPGDCVLHFIGQLQSNKARDAVDLFQVIESLDRLSLVNELEKQSARREIRLQVLLQVNVAGESQKAGCTPVDALALADAVLACPHLDLRGLMTMAPLVEVPDRVRPVFRGLRELRDRLRERSGSALPVLSMGMTNDFPIAIAEGATHVRIGRAIFG